LRIAREYSTSVCKVAKIFDVLSRYKFITSQGVNTLKLKQIESSIARAMQQGKKAKLIFGMVLLVVVMSFTTLINHSSVAIAQTVPTKLCSAVVPGTFRDSIPVPSTWRAIDCRNFASSVGANIYQLGCIYAQGAYWGRLNGTPPEANACGWFRE
jgi:hypothetical protein